MLFMSRSPYRIVESHRAATAGAVQMLRPFLSIATLAASAFRAFSEPEELVSRDMYGDLPLGCYVIPGARVAPTHRGDYGYVCSGDEPIVEQNADFLRKGKFLRPRFTEIVTDSAARKHAEDLVVLTSRCHNNFWHWMMDSLPKVLIAERCGFRGLYLVPPVALAPWAAESLQLVGISPERLITLDGASIDVERLYIPTYFCGYNAHFNREFSRIYREWILERVSPRREGVGRRIFVGRSESVSVRRLLNQSELASLLQKEGFEHIFFELLPLREQIRVASEASVLIGAHGSGLMHLLFMPIDSLVIELFPYKRQQTNNCYEAAAEIVPQRYRALESCAMRDGDVEVDPESIRGVLIEESVI